MIKNINDFVNWLLETIDAPRWLVLGLSLLCVLAGFLLTIGC